ncbi:hypothetical protein [Variovorax sp. YR566]|uniref:hypothetical protein n=1 Tax=Variovorax sp. YR566 TaxID=3450237 RepID=UPI003F801783
MAHFVVTFRIGNDSSYQERYESFMEKIHLLAGGVGSSWEETTSFVAFKAAGTAESIRDELYLKTKFSELSDVMVVIDVGARKKATKGAIKYPNTLSGALGF